MSPRGDDISESTRVKLKVGTLWGIMASVIATSVWLTALLLRLQGENQTEHGRLMLGLTELQSRADKWVTQQQLEEVVLYVARELHKGDRRMDAWREVEIREGVRDRLRAPKDSRP